MTRFGYVMTTYFHTLQRPLIRKKSPPTACLPTPRHDATPFRLRGAPQIAPVRHGPEATYAPGPA